MQFFLRYAYAPLFWSGFIGLATWQVGYRQASHIWLVALFLGALGLSFLAERRLPYQPRWNRPHADRLRDVLHASVNESLNTLGILALPMPFRGETVSAMAAAVKPARSASEPVAPVVEGVLDQIEQGTHLHAVLRFRLHAHPDFPPHRLVEDLRQRRQVALQASGVMRQQADTGAPEDRL
ncbi:hypothetical protein CR64_32740 [Pseudomonas aeruginosa]|nr:hypothetical protein CR64_32740 [Pseudomonas aeruginosa]